MVGDARGECAEGKGENHAVCAVRFLLGQKQKTNADFCTRMHSHGAIPQFLLAGIPLCYPLLACAPTQTSMLFFWGVLVRVCLCVCACRDHARASNHLFAEGRGASAPFLRAFLRKKSHTLFLGLPRFPFFPEDLEWGRCGAIFQGLKMKKNCGFTCANAFARGHSTIPSCGNSSLPSAFFAIKI